MQLLIERLSESPVAHQWATTAGWWEGRVGRRERAGVEMGPLHFSVDASLQGPDVHLTGRVGGQVEVQCSRCLKRYGQRLDDTFQIVLEPAGDRVLLDPESAEALARDGLSLGDEFETGWFRGPVIRLESVLAEVVSLALPLQPLCREDCAGLCPHCGCDRNETSCECEDLKPSSPFAVLATLRGDSGEGRT